MKKQLLFIASVLFIAVRPGLAQDIDNNDISFQYIQLPLIPLNKNLKNYQAEVVQKFEDLTKQKKAAYDAEVKKAEDEYNSAVANHDKLQKDAYTKYENDMAIWNKKPLAEQIMYASQKPQPVLIPKPVKYIPPVPIYPKSFDGQLLAGKYLKLNGYENANTNPVKITVTMFGYDYQNPILQEKITQKATAASGTTPAKPEIKKYFYTIKYKHMMSYKIETPEEGVITEIFPKELDSYSDYTTNDYDSVKYLSAYWQNNQKTILEQIQDKVVAENLSIINNQINDKYGYNKMNYATLLSVVDEKADYQDYKEAYVAAENGYKAIGNDVSKSAAIPELKKAIEKWENAMKESQPNNKKARVDGGVTNITILNLIEAYIWLDDYNNAKAYIDKLKTLDPSRKERHRMERMIALMDVQKQRWEANNR
ncbi:MAG: hypothetical protein ACJ76F_00760 [Bacteroidia bacterium]